MTAFAWNPAEHATYCPQHNPPPEDGGGSSWLCCCTEALAEREETTIGEEASPTPIPSRSASARVSGAEKDTA